MLSRALKNSGPLPNINKILVIRVDGIGDLLNSTPAIALLRENYPSAEITVLARPLNAPVLIGNPDVDRILTFDRDGKHRELSERDSNSIVRCAVNSFNLSLPCRQRCGPILMALLSGAPYRLGRYQKRFKSILTHAWRGKYRKGETHEVDRNLELVRLICEGEGKRELIFRLSPDETAAAETRVCIVGYR